MLNKLIKIIVFCVIAAGLIAGNFFLEDRVFAQEEQVKDAIVFFDYEAENQIPEGGIIRFDNSYDFSSSLQTLWERDLKYVFEFYSGKMWGNFKASNAKVNIIVDNVVLIPDHAQFDLEFDGEKIYLQVYGGDVYLGFLEEGIILSDYRDQYDNIFMNRMLVPRDTQVIIPKDKVSEEIKSLLFSKLSKEFKYTAIPSSDRESDWVKKNITNDEKYFELRKRNFVSAFIRESVKTDQGLLQKSVFWLKENLTFVPEKKEDIILNFLFSYLDNAIFYANEGEFELMEQSLTDFSFYKGTVAMNFRGSEKYKIILNNYIFGLSLFGPSEAHYDILKKLVEDKDDFFEIANIFWLDVYEAVDTGKFAAQKALELYDQYFDKTLGKIDDEQKYKNYIIFQNQLFDNLFLRYTAFYEDAYFAIKNSLEQRLLSLYQEGQLKEELKQAFISNKIDFLKRLRRFFFDGQVQVDQAKEIISRLFNEIDDLMPQQESKLAVVELFEKELDDIWDFWKYLDSPEYHSKTYGATHEDRFAIYLEDKDKIWSFIDVQQDITGEIILEDVSPEEVISAVEAIFTSYPEITSVEIGEVTDGSQRYVFVSGVIGGYPFEASYDRYNETLKDIYSYDELISERSVKISSLLSLLQNEFADIAEPEDGDEYTLETETQRLARVYIAKEVADAGFEANLDNVEIVDEDAYWYRLSNIYVKGYEENLLTFDYFIDSETVKNLYIDLDGEALVMEGEYTLQEVKAMAIAEGDFSTPEFLEESDDGILR